MAGKEFFVERMQPEDWDKVRSIYLEGIAAGKATFETAAPGWADWDAAHLPNCRLVARDGISVVGWAALSPVSVRSAYRGVAEVSVYVPESARGRGIGCTLVRRLIEESECNGIWTLQAGILAENQASIALHRKCGFREVGTREKIGNLDGQWMDVILMERRSRKAGMD